MPRLVFFRESDGRVPLLAWMSTLPTAANDKCRDRLARLREAGHELRRPVADYLRDGIHELRVRRPEANYRMLYFFHGREVVVVSHGFAKGGSAVPEREIDQAIQRRWRYESHPVRHRHEGEE
jgi:phage-related protein